MAISESHKTTIQTVHQPLTRPTEQATPDREGLLTEHTPPFCHCEHSDCEATAKRPERKQSPLCHREPSQRAWRSQNLTKPQSRRCTSLSHARPNRPHPIAKVSWPSTLPLFVIASAATAKRP